MVIDENPEYKPEARARGDRAPIRWSIGGAARWLRISDQHDLMQQMEPQRRIEIRGSVGPPMKAEGPLSFMEQRALRHVIEWSNCQVSITWTFCGARYVQTLGIPPGHRTRLSPALARVTWDVLMLAARFRFARLCIRIAVVLVAMRMVPTAAQRRMDDKQYGDQIGKKRVHERFT